MKDRKLTGRWAGFAFKGGALVTPEGRELYPHELAWLSLTAAMAREYQTLIDQEKRFGRREVSFSAEPCPVVPMVPALRLPRRV